LTRVLRWLCKVKPILAAVQGQIQQEYEYINPRWSFRFCEKKKKNLHCKVWHQGI